MNVTFIGLGIMGQNMARNLLPHCTLTVFNRSPQPVEALAADGATAATSLTDAVADADVVFTMLAKPEVVAAQAFGEEGFLQAMPNDSLWVDCSTVNPSFSREAAQVAKASGIRFLDAPVAGTRKPAEDGTLTFLVGGAEADLNQARPLLEQMGSKIVHTGNHGQGSAFKMLINAQLAQSMAVFAETTLLGEKLGFSREMLMDTLPNLPVSAPFLTGKAELIRHGQFEPQFPLELMLKDLHLLEKTAYEHRQPLFMSSVAKALYASADAAGHGRDDFSALHAFLDSHNQS